MSKAKSVLGKDLMLFIDGKAIALATSCKLGLSAETIDTQSKDSGIWTEKDIKKLSWNASSENVFSADADANSYDKLFALFLAHKPVVLKFGVVGNPDVNEMPAAGWTLAEGAYTGSAVITSLEANAPDETKQHYQSVSKEPDRLQRKQLVNNLRAVFCRPLNDLFNENNIT